MKKSLSKILAGITLGLGTLSPALLGSCRGPSKPTEIHIMSLSDIRGEIPGYGDWDFARGDAWKYPGAIRVADAMQEIADKSADYLIVSGGDQNTGGKFAACTQGNTMYPVMSAMNISYSAVGNHAWDYGLEKLEKPKQLYDALGRTARTEGNYFITSNVLEYPNATTKEWCIDETDPQFEADYKIWKTTKVDWADPYKVVDLAGHKICLIGLTTQSTLKDGNQTYIQERDYSFIDYNASVHYSKHLLKETDQETFNQIESFILLTHIGAEQDEETWIKGDAGNLANVIDTPIDAILAGHNRSNICGFVYNNKLDRKIAIAQTNDKMRTFIDLKLNFDDSKPVGQRFKSIEPQLIIPKIDASNFAAAKQQLDKIIANPRNKVVEKVCEAYATQKIISLAALNEEIGTTDNGLSYYQSGDLLYKYLYPEDIEPEECADILVEQAGAFVAKSWIEGFNTIYDKTGQTSDKYKKANIAYLSNVSIDTGIDPFYLEEGKVTYSEMYDLFPYDEHTVTASLTYHQLEQVVRYMLSGKVNPSQSEIYTDSFLFNPGSETSLTYSDLKFPFGPNQFYGFTFDVKQLDKVDKQHRKYDYVGFEEEEASKHSLKIYVPGVSDIDDLTTWKGKDYFDAQTGNDKYITIVMNSFDFDYGNSQNMMIKDFGLFNEQENPEPIHIHEFRSIDVADLFIVYLNTLQASGTKIAMSNDICKQLAHKVTA